MNKSTWPRSPVFTLRPNPVTPISQIQNPLGGTQNVSRSTWPRTTVFPLRPNPATPIYQLLAPVLQLPTLGKFHGVGKAAHPSQWNRTHAWTLRSCPYRMRTAPRSLHCGTVVPKAGLNKSTLHISLFVLPLPWVLKLAPQICFCQIDTEGKYRYAPVANAPAPTSLTFSN